MYADAFVQCGHFNSMPLCGMFGFGGDANRSRIPDRVTSAYVNSLLQCEQVTTQCAATTAIPGLESHPTSIASPTKCDPPLRSVRQRGYYVTVGGRINRSVLLCFRPGVWCSCPYANAGPDVHNALVGGQRRRAEGNSVQSWTSIAHVSGFVGATDHRTTEGRGLSGLRWSSRKTIVFWHFAE